MACAAGVVAMMLGLIALLTYVGSSHKHVVDDGRDMRESTLMALATKGKHKLTSKKSSAELGCKVDIMILRHCERGDIKSHCTPEGFARAEYIATQFGEDKSTRWPKPDFLFARPPEGKKLVHREIETLIPLSEKFDLPIRSEGYEVAHKKDMVGDIFHDMRQNEMCGKLLVVSWKHENIPKLARAFGCGPEQGCPSVYPSDSFGVIWEIRYTFDAPEFPNRKRGKFSKPEWTIQGSVQREWFDMISWDKKIRLEKEAKAKAEGPKTVDVVGGV